MTLPKRIPAFEVTKDTPYLALTGELWDVFGEYYVNNDRVIKGLYCIWNHIVKQTLFFSKVHFPCQKYRPKFRLSPTTIFVRRPVN